MSRNLKQVAGIFVIIATLGLFAYFLKSHNVAKQLQQVSPFAVALVLGLYLAMTVILALVYDLSVRLCGKVIGRRENFLLTCYSSIVNFFGPLQSGPGVRAIYLRRQLGIPLKKYASVSLYYYACFAGLSAVWFVAGWAPLWLLITCFVIGSFILSALLNYALTRIRLEWRLLIGLFWLVAAQLIIVTIIYGLELHAIGVHPSVRELITYTGAANFALFVSLTPGALGFREGFLLLTRQLTHLDSQTIVAANLLDRALYIVFLGGLFLFVLALHGQQRMQLKGLLKVSSSDV